MRSVLRSFLCSLILLSATLSVQAQTAKKYYSAGKKFMEMGNCQEAVNNFTKALEMDPQMEDVYISRAECYEKMDKKTEAAEDYRLATTFAPKEEKYFYNAGRLYFEIRQFEKADEMLKKALSLNKNYLDAIEYSIYTLLQLKKFTQALTLAEQAVDLKKSGLTYLNNAIVLDSMQLYAEAEKKYKDAKYYDSKLVMAYVGLSNTQVKLKKLDDAMKTCQTGMEKFVPARKEILFARSQVYAAKGDYLAAVNDLTQVILADDKSVIAFMTRGDYYLKLAMYPNAVNDYTKVILIQEKNANAYFKRAQAYEQMQNYKEAVKDYNKIKEIAPNDQNAMNYLVAAKQKLFELNREKNKPEIVMISPKADKKFVVKIGGDKKEMMVKGTITDESNIKSITVNGKEANFRNDTNVTDFIVTMDVTKLEQLTVIVTDVYNNVLEQLFAVEYTETGKPIVALVAPYTSFDKEIYLDNSNSELYIEGQVKDESKIESIRIEGQNASFDPSAQDPKFSATISISNKMKITVWVKDVYGNETIEDFKLNREGATISANNPMGVTWLIFIENSNYKNFASLDGPSKDVTLMKTALANYKFSNIVHKKDMTKAELDKFLSIELRDLIKANKVNSLMIWYAGHGKFQNNTGYWIPVDAKVDEEYSYFSIATLKSYMQSYSLVHTLVVTDACESGPTFLVAMRAGTEQKMCDDWTKTKFKSAQVFTSAGFELAADNSQFTKTFANTLINNPDGCIAIDKIVEKVKLAVKAKGMQEPKFGKISGLEDEGGTFFFMKK
ncbi:MAG: tetratricopeptide repeat protein [Bacteroidia bacterium]|nr:tetratricopeptide repeat protein [Bacteroidia bacterium]